LAALAVAAALAGTAAISAAPAHAAPGDLTVYGASVPGGGAVPAGPWSGINYGSVSGGSFGVSMPGDPGAASGGWSQTATLGAPANMTFSTVTATRNFDAPVSAALHQPRITTTWETRGWTGGGYGGDSASGSVTVNHPAALSIRVSCEAGMGGSDPAPRCTSGGYWHASHMAYGLRDEDAPVAALANSGGALLDGTWKTDDTQLELTASDSGSGIFRAFLRQGTTTYYASVDPNNSRCQDARPGAGSAYEFSASSTSLVPCRLASQAYTPTFDLSGLGDGTHAGITVGVEDASGREAVIASNRTLKINLKGGALPDEGSIGPGGCIYEVDGTTCNPPLASTGKPVLTGTAQEDEALSTTAGTWTGTTGSTTYSYVWESCPAGGPLTSCTPIGGATGSTYTLKSSDVGKQVRSRVTATQGGSSQTAISDPSATVAAKATGGGGGGGGGGGAGGTGKVDSSKPDAPGPAPAPGPEPGPVVNVPPVVIFNGQNASDRASVCAGPAKKACANTSKHRAVTTVTVGYGQEIPISGKLLAPDGTPIIGAIVDVTSRDNSLAARGASTETVRTNDQGVYRYIAPVGVSRTITFGYKTRIGDEKYAGSSTVVVAVKASVTAKVNKKRARNGQMVVFRGKVAGAPKGSGKKVELQAWNGRIWTTIRAPKLDRNGAYKASWRFKNVRGVNRFKFRTRVLPSTGWPFEAGQSRVVRLTVVG